MKYFELAQNTCWDSDKSVAFEAEASIGLTEMHRGKSKNVRIFVPRSMIEESRGSQWIASWILDRKREELCELGHDKRAVDSFLDSLIYEDSFYEKADTRFKLYRIFDFLDDASQRLSTPKIVFHESFGTIKLSKAGSRSKHHGKVFITNGEDWGSVDRIFYGSIDLTGLYTPSNDATDEVKDFLKNLNNNPEEVISKYGISSGNCCFCQRALTTERSKEVGYGPKCATNYEMTY